MILIKYSLSINTTAALACLSGYSNCFVQPNNTGGVKINCSDQAFIDSLTLETDTVTCIHLNIAVGLGVLGGVAQIVKVASTSYIWMLAKVGQCFKTRNRCIFYTFVIPNVLIFCLIFIAGMLLIPFYPMIEGGLEILFWLLSFMGIMFGVGSFMLTPWYFMRQYRKMDSYIKENEEDPIFIEENQHEYNSI